MGLGHKRDTWENKELFSPKGNNIFVKKEEKRKRSCNRYGESQRNKSVLVATTLDLNANVLILNQCTTVQMVWAPTPSNALIDESTHLRVNCTETEVCIPLFVE